MFKLILDKSHLPMYKDFFPESSPENLSGMFYRFLQSFSRPIVSSIFGEQFIPIKMLVSIRTDRTNEMIVPDNGKFYTDCTSEYPNEHPLDDQVLLAAKSMVDKYFDCGEDLTKVIPRTIPLPIGACLRNDIIYVYITLVVDHKLKSEESAARFENELRGCREEERSRVLAYEAAIRIGKAAYGDHVPNDAMPQILRSASNVAAGAMTTSMQAERVQALSDTQARKRSVL